jgi:hypothetical protein
MTKQAVLFTHTDGDRPVASPFDYEHGLPALYQAIGCDLVEVAANGTFAGLAVTLIVDEEGLYRQPTINRHANDFAAEITGNAIYALRPSLVGPAVVVFDTGDDWRGFTPDELATVLDTLRNGGYTVAAAA